MPLYASVYLEERPIAVKRIYITFIQEKIVLTQFWGKIIFYGPNLFSVYYRLELGKEPLLSMVFTSV